MKTSPAKQSPYGSQKFTTIDEYHKTFPAPVRKLLDELRLLIRETAPEAEEVISYNMPAFKWKGMLVYYAAYAQHIGFYPTASPIAFFGDDLVNYKTSKGAIQFPLEGGIPKTLVKKIVQFKLKENAAKAAAKK